MRVLLLHAEDSAVSGPWSRQRWDLIVDLGKSARFSEQRWSAQLGCPVLRADAFGEGVADARRVRELLFTGRGRLLDEEGIDWWELTNLRVAGELLSALILRRVAAEIKAEAELWTTRTSWQATVLGGACNREMRSFGKSGLAAAAEQARHYAAVVRRFPAAQIKQIFLDKYDADYRWRSRFSARPKRSTEPVVLLPSAYENVSRMAAAYARLLPEQRFLMITTRWSAEQFSPTPNVEVRELAAYAGGEYPARENAALQEGWQRLKEDLCGGSEFRMLLAGGILEAFPAWFRDGLCVRNAWREAIEHEPVCGVLCGDDSNMYTRLPVLLAAKRKIATVDFHHGALNGHYLMKDLPSDLYLAKNEMERDYLLRVCGLPEKRVVMGAPASIGAGTRDSAVATPDFDRQEGTSAVLFSEPYEVLGMRAEEVYRELLPPLLGVVRENGRGLVIKLHPFESRAQRIRMVREIVTPEERKLVTVVDGPLTQELLSRAWFGITVESTTVMDCVERGIGCFLCGWLQRSAYEYVQQYARFGVGEELQNAEQIREIPARLAALAGRVAPSWKSITADATKLQGWLGCGAAEGCGARLGR